MCLRRSPLLPLCAGSVDSFANVDWTTLRTPAWDPAILGSSSGTGQPTIGSS
ncbi:hypothetical protein K432DRAFT_410951 [Lepidopterella palustris CBS 459.81]|uniref:Uncharacterized protein n=1 Tax=Lepidopterella palustris CBS 459.81 TaxID=1314670 RepID=A0A8E2J8D5_9PEZI|nr:hypothetical protein K432DRAFT_410951 [Lepidopterella palustris CBS 459.81]